ncbi:hypothetical protein ACMT4L_20515 [Deinococcus sp. A31D244]|uniref:hypothetical protein n=1 Tax=Deinococcus sp. A31D244 TaxID=3397675 RepID=UPI0039DF5D98
MEISYPLVIAIIADIIVHRWKKNWILTIATHFAVVFLVTMIINYWRMQSLGF